MPATTSLDERAGLRGRTAVVLGGAEGLGRACADDLAGVGVRVAVADKDVHAVARAAERMAAAGGFARVVDVRDADAISAFYAAADGAWGGRLDIAINVVGGTFEQRFEDSTPRGWAALTDSNYTWLLRSTQLAIPRMRAAGGGSIVAITSIEAFRAAPGYAVYAGLKAAVENFSRSLAVELAPEGIRVNTIAPDIVPTQGLARLMDVANPAEAEAEELSFRTAIPIGRRGDYGDIGGCALFLASDLSRYVTGTTIHADGGTWAAAGWHNWQGHGFRNRPPNEIVRPPGESR